MKKEKFCKRCKRSFPLNATHFVRRSATPDGYTAQCITCYARDRSRQRGGANGYAASRYPALAERHDRIVHWEGGPTRLTVLSVNAFSSMSCRAHVQEEPGGPVYTIPCRWLLEHSEPVAS